MNFVNLLLSILSFRARAFERATLDPMAAQRKILFEYLGRNRNSEYGRKFDFAAIKSIEDYRRRVPLSDCETMRPYLERMARGERNILTSNEVVFFGATSGTTNKPKLIPSTKFSEDRKAELTGLWAYYISRDHPNVTNGRILAIVSPEIEGYTESGIPYGAETGYGYRKLPAIVKNLYCLPNCVFDIKDYEARYYSILRMSMAQDITTIASLNPNSIILLCQKISKWQSILIDDIGKGSLNEKFDIPADIRNIIGKGLGPDPKRARELKKIIDEKGELLPKYFWPNMELIECWKAGTMRLYLNELKQFFGNVRVRDIGCLSTEARSSIPISDEGAGGVLAIGTNFYEFLPREMINAPDKRTLLCDELEVGKEYFIIVTTPGGLYRYNIDDIVRVDSLFNKTPVIEFVQKGTAATSLAGEKLYESQVNEAVNNVMTRNRVFMEFFCAVAKPSNPPHYVFLTEFSSGSERPDVKKLLADLENEFCRQNREYEYTRGAQLLGAPVLKIAGSGEYEKYRAGKISGGAHEGQFKLPRLTSEPSFDSNFRIEEEVRL